MFIIAPVSIILVSLIAIAIIVWRKRPYLDKLYALNTSGTGDYATESGFSWAGIGIEMFPEIKVVFDKIKIHEYKSAWLTEAEKFLRRTRLVFLRVDRLSDSLIKKIRRVHVNGQLNGHAIAEVQSEDNDKVAPGQVQKETISPAFLKNEESRLIMEIAKNPKDSKLYESLGDLYLEMGNWSDAKESYEASIELTPQNESLHKKLSSVLEKLGHN